MQQDVTLTPHPLPEGQNHLVFNNTVKRLHRNKEVIFIMSLNFNGGEEGIHSPAGGGIKLLLLSPLKSWMNSLWVNVHSLRHTHTHTQWNVSLWTSGHLYSLTDSRNWRNGTFFSSFFGGLVGPPKCFPLRNSGGPLRPETDVGRLTQAVRGRRRARSDQGRRKGCHGACFDFGVGGGTCGRFDLWGHEHDNYYWPSK